MLHYIRDPQCIQRYLDLDSANYLQLPLCLIISNISIHSCMVSRSLTSPNFNVFRINRPALWQSHLDLLGVFHCFVPFNGYQLNLEYCSRSVFWRTKSFMKNSLLILTPCVLHHSHSVHWDQTKDLVCQSLGSRITQVQEHFTLVSLLFGTASRCLSIQSFQLLPSRNIWRHISLTWPFPHRHQPPDSWLMLWSCFVDFAVEHQFGWYDTEPAFSEDIGTIEI